MSKSSAAPSALKERPARHTPGGTPMQMQRAVSKGRRLWRASHTDAEATVLGGRL